MAIPVALLGPLVLATLGAAASVVAGLLWARRAAAREDGARVGAPRHWLDDRVREEGADPAELLRQVRRIHLRTGRRVDALMLGEYQSVFRGQGMEFEEVRDYVPGDDVRAIDWNVTARLQRPFVKVFREERELSVMILVDVSASGDFGTRGRWKGELAAELAATLAFAAIRNHDRVGLLLFTDRVERFIPPKKGRGHVYRVIQEVLGARPEGRGTDLSAALQYLDRVLRKRSVVFVVSDFLSGGGWEQALQRVDRRHDLCVFHLSDPGEHTLPDVGFLALEDAEDGRRAWVDTSSSAVRTRFATDARQRLRQLETSLRRIDVDFVPMSTDGDVGKALLGYFRARERRARA